MKKKIIMLIIFLLLLLLLSNLAELDMDGIWSYGFSYNIANDLIPYRDYSMIIGPIYPLFFSIFIKIFGNYLIAFEFGNALVYSFILMHIYKKIGNKVFYFIFFLILQPSLLNYNIFCSLIFISILILLDSNKKSKNIIIGILIGIIFMIKHNIGISIFFVYFFSTRKHVKAIISFLIPILISSVYLIINNAFFDYINYCYLGIGSFLNNFLIEIPILLISLIIYYNLIRLFIRTKDIKIIYILFFQIVLFPIINVDHFISAIIPIIYYYFLLNDNNINLFLKAISLFLVIGSSLSLISSSQFITKDNFFKYKIIKNELNEYLVNYTNYINKIDGKVYVFIFNQYLLKIYNNDKINFYDLINKGNLGINKEKLLNQLTEDCSMNKCSFILDKVYFKEKYYQLDDDFKKYVIDNCTYIETLPSGDRLYANFKD